MMGIESFFEQRESGGWNCLEVHILSDYARIDPKEATQRTRILPVALTETKWKHLKEKLGCNSVPHIVYEYYNDDMVDIYDQNGDMHKVLQREAISDLQDLSNMTYAVAYRQEVIPTYRFPNTYPLLATVKKHVTTHRVTNRIHVIFEEIEEGDVDQRTYTAHVQVQNLDKVDQARLLMDVRQLMQQLVQ